MVLPSHLCVTDAQTLKVPLPLTASLTKYSCPTSRPAISNGEEEGILGCVVGVGESSHTEWCTVGWSAHTGQLEETR